MTREEIEKFSGIEPYCFETVREENWYRIGCIDGMEAADANPDLSSLWHDASEIPDRQGNLLYILPQGGLHISNIPSALRTCKLDKVRWEEYAEELGVVKWAYISDLLPKGGEK